MTNTNPTPRVLPRRRPGGFAGLRPIGRGLVVLASTLVVLPGCGNRDPDEIPAVSASGTITYKGKPLESGTVQFAPEKGRVASGTIEGGKFTLMTYNPGDGAVPGKHAVSVISMKSRPARPGAEPEETSAIDPKFTDPGSSGLVIEIPAGGKTDIQLDLN